MGRYSMPKPTATERVARDARRRRRGPLVRGPEDLVFADQVATASGPDARELSRVRERAAQLEGALAAAADLERRATAELERVRDDRREELERMRAELVGERERHAAELLAVREQLAQRERELRTLVLEMGKTQGRLEVAERRLIESSHAPAPVVARSRSGVGERWQSWVALTFLLAIGVYGAGFLWEFFRYQETYAAESDGVRGERSTELGPDRPSAGPR